MRIYFPALNREQLVDCLRQGVASLARELPLRRVVLFGSWAAGRATAFSDIDLLVVYAGPPREDAYQLVWRTVKMRGLEPHVYTEDEAAQLQSVFERMTRDGITLL